MTEPPDADSPFPFMPSAAWERLTCDLHMLRLWGDRWRLLDRYMVVTRAGGRRYGGPYRYDHQPYHYGGNAHVSCP